MAEVYLAKTVGVSGFEKRLALKVIRSHYAEDEHFIRMLVEEAKIAVQLSHSNIVHVFDLGCSEGAYYLTMEYVDGPDLFRILKGASARNFELPIEMAAYVASQVCAGLEHAHAKCDSEGKPLGIVHRDVSPQNVLVSQAGEVKLVDFGIAKAALRAAQTRAGVIKGKYHYMSPEQAWGDPVDPRSDIFSCGVLLYEMLAGGMVYGEEPAEQLVGMVRRAEIPVITTRRPNTPAELAEIVMKALARDREERFQSARAFAMALDKFLAGYAPDFGASRLAQLVRGIVADDGGMEGLTDRRRAKSPSSSMHVALRANPEAAAAAREQPIGAARIPMRVGAYERSENDDLADSLGRSQPPHPSVPLPRVDSSFEPSFVPSLGAAGVAFAVEPLRVAGVVDTNPAQSVGAPTVAIAGAASPRSAFVDAPRPERLADWQLLARRAGRWRLRAAVAMVALGLAAVIAWYVIG